ncbi:FixH family protein [Ferruginibacter sp. HRS2-29]|uniref:FixH family protein n=1 Tax=Ferruginibacter sp. HRS2-29 TaxID=2487334 RepID=UPI0020CDB7DA|nr:FixH family protein [Ferruginibacter sp. HRS2-29]MCP9752993.1 hypothetical protein [Ferruginibacter sp. HRS2-29]
MTKSFFHAGNVVLAGFGCMVIFMSYLVYQCTQHPSSMISDHYYEKEMLYQQTINATGNASSYHFSAVAQRDTLHINIPQTLSASLSSGTAYLYCASESEQDKQFQLTPGQADYNFDIRSQKKRPYLLRLSLKSGGKEYYKELPVTIP